MKVLAFAASNSTTSINRALVGYAAQRLKALHPAADVKFVDINDYEMPIYSPDRQNANGYIRWRKVSLMKSVPPTR